MPQIEQQLREPENWQDFETLCKKLWGEIWNCQEIKKNGSAGQKQKGVDLYGIPEFELTSNDPKKYYGIQCKKKDKKKNNKITTTEIDEEIKEAKIFKPSLKKYYIATTTSKDADIEEFVRDKSLQNINQGLFQVEIFFWEDIVTLIDENRYTHDWYIKNKGYKTKYKINFTFDDNSKTLFLKPIFRKIITEYKLKPTPKPIVSQLSEAQVKQIESVLGIDLTKLTNLYEEASRQTIASVNIPRFIDLPKIKSIYDPPQKNYSRLDFSFLVLNKGNITIEDFKIRLNFVGNFRKLGVCRKGHWTSIDNHKYDAFMSTDLDAVLTPFDKILVPEDQYEFDTFFLFPFHDTGKIDVKWKFFSREYNDDGVLEIQSNPDFKEEKITKMVEDENAVKIDEKIEEYEEERE